MNAQEKGCRLYYCIVRVNVEGGRIDVEGEVQSKAEDRGNNGCEAPEDEMEENEVHSDD